MMKFFVCMAAVCFVGVSASEGDECIELTTEHGTIWCNAFGVHECASNAATFADPPLSADNPHATQIARTTTSKAAACMRT